MQLQGKVAIVTGGGSGIGAAICRLFVRNGAQVAVLDIDGEAAEQVAASIEGGIPVVVDVADSSAVDDAVSAVEKDLGPLDVLVNNAGIGGRSEVERMMPRAEAQLMEAAQGRIETPLESAVNLTDDEWNAMIAVHLNGTFHCTRAALRSMAARGSGTIVNVASICGLEGCTGSPHYSAAKGGILAFTRAVAKEVILQGIRVNAIAPGYIDTPMADVMTPTMRAVVALQTPQGRWGTPEEVANTALFLTSDESSFFVGATLSPNGGILTAV
ncbi:MAG: SDR family NAD(P)-dependent oxidoreductase [Acidimicrobiia bacterium]